MAFKYIMFDVTISTTTWKMPIIFPDKLIHSDMAECATIAIHLAIPKAIVKAVNAGTLNQLKVVSTDGDSETLNLKYNEDDATVINAYEYLHGIT